MLLVGAMGDRASRLDGRLIEKGTERTQRTRRLLVFLMVEAQVGPLGADAVVDGVEAEAEVLGVVEEVGT